MRSSQPDKYLLILFAALQLLALTLAFTVIPSVLAGGSVKFMAVVLVVSVLGHFGLTYSLLITADPHIERPAETSAVVTLTLIAVSAFPTEPRLAQGLCAAAFVGVVAWQVLLRSMDE